MPITGVPIGGSGIFSATPVPAGAVIPAGVVPKWTSSDVTIATVDQSADPTGLTCKVTFLVAGSITLTVAATLPDSTVAQGSAVVPGVAGEVKSFIVDQTA